MARWAWACALAAASAAAESITITSRPIPIYSTVTSKIRIQGTGFDFHGDGTNLHLKFVPNIPASSYSVVTTSDTALSILLKSGKAWPLPAGLDETTLYLAGVTSDTAADPAANLLDEPKAIATVLATPSVIKREDRLVYMTGSMKLLINGTHFRAKSTTLTFDPPLYKDVDYVMTVKSPKTAQLTLVTGRKWRSDGAPGPLKLKRIDTGAGALRVDAKYGGVIVAEVQADLGAHGVTVETTSDKKYYQSAKELTVLGHGFNDTAPSANLLRWGNKLIGRGTNYTVTRASTNSLTLALVPGSKWRPNPANLPGKLTLLAVNAGAGLVAVGATQAKKGRAVATIYADPSLKSQRDKVVFRTLTHELWVVGGGFVRGTTTLELVGETPGEEPLRLRPFVDYVLVVFNATHLRVALRDGKAWAAGPGGALKAVALDTGAGPVPSVSKDLPRTLAQVEADALHESGASIERSATTQLIYETPALKHLKVSGEHLCAKGFNGDTRNVKLGFAPPLAEDVYRVDSASESQVRLSLQGDKKWPVGTLYLASVTCGDKVVRSFAGGAGVGVATVLPDPVVEPHPELTLYGAHSRRLVVRGSGFAPEGTQLTLEPTPSKNFRVVEVTEHSVLLELTEDGAWAPDVDALPEAGVQLKVTRVDTGAGEVRLEDVVVATVVKEPEGDVCDDSCEWALDGVCDDGTAPSAEDDWATSAGGERWDDDWGGDYDDFASHYYAGFYDDAYGAYFDDAADLPACPYGTDCTDCQPLHGDATYTERDAVECDNSCEFSRDGFCDDPRTNGYCALGTDCQDCGPASAGNFSTYDDDEWWDDDEANWYWDDDYYDDDYAGRRIDDFYADDEAEKPSDPHKGDDDAAYAGFIRSTDPFAVEPEPADTNAGLLLVGALAATAAVFACCGAWRFAKGGCRFKGRDGEKADLASAWTEMTARPGAKKTNVPLTGDRVFTGEHSA